MVTDFLKQITEETVLNYPNTYEKGQTFGLVFAEAKGVEFGDASNTKVTTDKNTLMHYVYFFESLPSELVHFLLADKILREYVDIHEDELEEFTDIEELEMGDEYTILYNQSNQKFYLFNNDDIGQQSLWFKTTREVEGLPAGSHIYDFGEGFEEGEPFKAYAQDGVLRTFPLDSICDLD